MARLYAVQARLSIEHYSDPRSFREWVEALAAAADEAGGLSRDSLLVYPEDIGTFLLLAGADPHARSLEEALRGLLARHLPAVALHMALRLLPPLKAYLRARWKLVWQAYRDAFSAVAAAYKTNVVAGSILEPRGRKVYNTSYLFAPDGRIAGRQSKVHLIDMEERLGVSPAPLGQLRVYETGAGRVGIAVCLDAFKEDVVSRLARLGADILAQPSANPEPWTPSLEEEWRRGAWLAVQRHRFRAGVNPMAVGRIYDLAFEGVSSIVAPRSSTPDGTGYLAKAKTKDGEEIVYAEA